VHGYEIQEAENGEQALEQITRHAPDVLLLDVMMPRMDGFEVCRRLKNSNRTASIQVLMVTALSERKERMMGIAAGANDFLNKPIDRQDIILRVRNAMQTRALLHQVEREKQRCERLLESVLPRKVAERMLRGESEIADMHSDATILMAGLTGFSALSDLIGPSQMVLVLNEIIAAFDDLAEQLGLEKVRAGGGTYAVASGLSAETAGHTQAVGHLACKLHEAIVAFNCQYRTCVGLRIGIATGAVLAGVVGRKQFAYELWGEPVDRAREIGTWAAPGTTHVDEATYERLKDVCLFSDSQQCTPPFRDPQSARRLSGMLEGAPVRDLSGECVPA
jgi:CheY-like chemotaxis protein